MPALTGALVHANAQRTALNVALANAVQLIVGQVAGNFDQREGREDFNIANVATVNATFTSNRSDNRTGLHAVFLANLNAVSGTGTKGCLATTTALVAWLQRTILITTALE